MQRRKQWTLSFEPAGLTEIKNKVLEWINNSGTFLYLDSHGYADPYGRYEMLAACHPIRWLETPDALRRAGQDDWCFGHLAYDYKNQLFPGLHSRHAGSLGPFRDMAFFVPETVCYIARDSGQLVLETYGNAEAIAGQIQSRVVSAPAPLPVLSFQRRQKEADYYQAIREVLAHIAAGDCYELNYCCEALAHAPGLNPLQVYLALKQKAPMPFSAYYRNGDAWMMGASPERFFCKSNNQLTAQPIKGTAARGANKKADEAAITHLRQSGKEQAENVMIVDLMRNDLARCCQPGTVRVEELFGIYTFPTVHQMISTVSGTLAAGISLADILERTFPMGSMTGAPKKRVLEIIDALEESRRGLYAGTVGYQAPGGAADFNVVIRSLIYDAATGKLSYHTGGAITHQSTPEQEWAELLLKGRSLEQLFAG